MSSTPSMSPQAERLAECYAALSPELTAFLSGVLRNRDLAEEVLHDVFVKAIESADEIPDDGLRPWLYRVSLNAALTIKRRQKVELKARERLPWIAREPEPTPMQVASQRERIDELQAALKTLPLEQQQVVRMRIHEGKKFAEIAEELDIPLGTALTRMRLALEKLRSALENDKD